jgi:hypothetical protein
VQGCHPAHALPPQPGAADGAEAWNARVGGAARASDAELSTVIFREISLHLSVLIYIRLYAYL